MNRGNTKRGAVFGFEFPWFIASGRSAGWRRPMATRWCRCVRSGPRCPRDSVVWKSPCLGVSVAIFVDAIAAW